MKEQELFAIPVPEATDSYAPVSHQQIVEEIEENIYRIGLNITSKKYQTAQRGDIVTGVIDLQAESDTFNYRLGFQNSYNKQRPLSFVGGTSVFVCTNGMMLGDTKFVRRHTGSIVQEMNERIQQVMDDLDHQLEKTLEWEEKMKSIEINPVATAELCGRLFMEQEIITSSQLNIIKSQLHDPDYPEFADPTLWSLYNHTTHALKKTHAYEYNQKHKELQTFIERTFNI